MEIYRDIKIDRDVEIYSDIKIGRDVKIYRSENTPVKYTQSRATERNIQ